MTGIGEWVQVVPPTLLDQGQAAFANWLADHGIGAEQIPPDDIRVDVIRVHGGSRMRYLIRRETLDRLGLDASSQ